MEFLNLTRMSKRSLLYWGHEVVSTFQSTWPWWGTAPWEPSCSPELDDPDEEYPDLPAEVSSDPSSSSSPSAAWWDPWWAAWCSPLDSSSESSAPSSEPAPAITSSSSSSNSSSSYSSSSSSSSSHSPSDPELPDEDDEAPTDSLEVWVPSSPSSSAGSSSLPCPKA